MSRRWLVAPILALACILAAPHAPAQTKEPPSIEDVPTEIAHLLGDYGRAYRTHDEALLRAVTAGDLAATEVRALQHVKSVVFSRFDVETVTQFSGNLASPRIKERYTGDGVATYQVVERSQIGAETGIYEDDGAFTFVRDGARSGYGGWRIVSKSDLDVLGFFSPYHVWDTGDVAVLESRRFVLLTHPETADVMRPVLEIAEKAYDRAAAFWPGPQEDRYVIIAPSTTAELGRIMHETVDLEKFVAFVAAGADRTTGWEPTGPRMFVHMSHLRSYGAAAQTEIVAHELIHAITRKASGPNTPTWVEEGLANLGGGSGRAGSHPGPALDTFPSNDRFVTGPVAQIQSVYDQAQAAIETLVDEKGQQELAEFYAELGSRRVVPGTDDYHVRDAIAKSSGWSFDAWVDAWRKRLG
jgi:hypothetical protein